MAQVLVRDIDAAVVARLKARARSNGRSLEAELRQILEREAGGGAVAEVATRYLIERAPPLSDTHREEPPGSGIWVPKRRGPRPDFAPIKAEGRPASEILIEDRRW